MSPEEDVAQAVVEKWNATEGLATVPLWRDRVEATSRPSMPYAMFTVRASKEPTYFAPVQVGAKYIDYRKVEITVFGNKFKSEELYESMSSAFLSWPALGTSSTLIYCRPLPTDAIKPDTSTRRGEDVWRATVQFEVATERAV